MHTKKKFKKMEVSNKWQRKGNKRGSNKKKRDKNGRRIREEWKK